MTKKAFLVFLLFVSFSLFSLSACSKEPTDDTFCAHSFSSVSALEPTCTEDGYTAHTVCSLCGEKEGYTALPAAHKYGKIDKKEPTEMESGYTEHMLCSVCGYRDGYVKLPETHEHALTQLPSGESNPMFCRCECGFSAVSELRTRPGINQLTDLQYEQFLKLYNMLKNRESSCELNISAPEAELFYYLLLGQCPEHFLVEYENSALAISTNGASWNPDCMSVEEFEATAKNMLGFLLKWEWESRALSDAEKVKYMVEWMSENTVYSNIGTHIRSLYGGLIEGELCCVGYSEILSWSLNAFGIPCFSLNGAMTSDNEGHMWNIVKLDGEWYQVDPGWNVVSLNGTNYSHNGFVNVTDAELGVGKHRVYSLFYGECGIDIPVCTAKEQSIARLDGLFIENKDDAAKVFEAALKRAVSRGEDVFSLISGSGAVHSAAVDCVSASINTVKSYGIKAFRYQAGHDERTGIYFVSVLLSLPNTERVSVTDASVKTGVGYKLAVRQNANGQMLFFSGNSVGSYLSTVSDPARATDVFYKEVEGGFRIWFMDGFLKKYIDLVKGEKGQIGLSISLTPSTVYNFDSESGAISAELDGSRYWIGTYGEYSTLGANSISYISGDSATTLDKSQFPARFVTVDGTAPTEMFEPPIPTGTGTAYKMVIEQSNLEKTLYFQGWRTRNFPSSTTNKDVSPYIYLEEVEGGYQLYYLWGENKMYIHAHGFGSSGVSLQLKTTPGAVFNYREDLNLYTVKIFGTEYYIGTYGEYDNFSLNNISYISGNNAGQVGVSQFPAYLVAEK